MRRISPFLTWFVVHFTPPTAEMVTLAPMAFLLVHLPLVVRRNYRVIQAVEGRSGGRGPSQSSDQ